MIAKAKIRSLGREIWKNRQKYVLMLPFLVVFFVFVIVPILTSVALSFTDFNMLQTPRFTGPSNYIRMFLDDDVFVIAVRNTLIFAVLTGPLSYFLCFFLAWMINDLPPRFRWVLTLLFYAPALASNIFYIWTYIFSGDMYGLVNSTLMRLGLLMEPVQWLTDSKYIMVVIIIVQLWMSLGTGFLAFIAGLQSVDGSMYEAGAIDGVRNRWQQLWYITLPVMKPMLMFGAVMQISASFSVSTVPMTLAGFPSTDNAAATVVSHMIDHGILRYEMGYASAIAVVLFVVMVLFKQVISRILQQD
ncbi:MAG: sugar ABC transporter permease [Clostridia bacterium]|nr:sugar ABC transporter permease [Clostridia bacterium]